MVLPVEIALEADADRIADVHMAAFGSNALLRTQFPTPDVRTQLRDCIAAKAAADIRDPHIAVLVVRDQDQIVSFAKWSLPVQPRRTTWKRPGYGLRERILRSSVNGPRRWRKRSKRRWVRGRHTVSF